MRFKNIVVVSSKGGVGKTVFVFHILSYLLRRKKFRIIEIDDNNNSSLSFSQSNLLENRVTSCDVSQGFQKLEELVIENMFEDELITVIDSGGGNDSKKVINSIIRQELTTNTLFIIPFLADFSQISNLIETVDLVKKYNYAVVINNINLSDKNDLMFIDGNDDFEIQSFKKIFDNFFIIEKTNLFSYSTSRYKTTIYDFAQRAFKFNQNEILEFAKKETFGEKTAMLNIYRDWKISRLAKDYLLNSNIKLLEDYINE
ncbi:ParA family protein [Arcobacter arenosus]|uniref:ParA family protein n=1 Tax=Arcobacter arenosus TaxID=2576037 RepID=A0A5R8XYL2_9BACT|nr:ParA family protein [Arcobacter arenosus]TLP36208.1 ParA family protein [Arcobacter arenosus]